MPRVVDHNTQAAGYTTRRTQFADIVSYWRPLLLEYFKMNEEQQAAWRAADPFLDDILRFCQAVFKTRKGEL